MRGSAKVRGNGCKIEWQLGARNSRRDATDVEAKLWPRLKGRQVRDAKFRRQVPFGRYVADFCCLDARLIVELDGDQHAENPRDEIRTQSLERRGFKVLRFWNHEVNQNLQGVLETILAEVTARC